MLYIDVIEVIIAIIVIYVISMIYNDDRFMGTSAIIALIVPEIDQASFLLFIVLITTVILTVEYK